MCVSVFEDKGRFFRSCVNLSLPLLLYLRERDLNLGVRISPWIVLPRMGRSTGYHTEYSNDTVYRVCSPTLATTSHVKLWEL